MEYKPNPRVPGECEGPIDRGRFMEYKPNPPKFTILPPNLLHLDTGLEILS